MSARTFLDTNVLVYCFDNDEPTKQSRAREIVDTVGRSGNLVLSTQVLQEFYVTVSRKLQASMPESEALEATRHLMAFHVVQVDVHHISSAMELSQRHRLSFWDALIIQAALGSGCQSLLSEDLQGGSVIHGLEISNPFA